MSGFSTKVYIVQRAKPDGTLGDIIAVKLTCAVAHEIAKAHAPAKVVFGVADKTPELNVERWSSKHPAP